jgi:hypothetical protein
MLAPTSFELTCPATKMKTFHLSPTSVSSPSFALISVLALVSLAALTATAFLASARLERQATMPLTQTTVLEMALSAGAECAKEVIDLPLRHFNHVTTYWRGTGPNDWTNELGYLLNGSALRTGASFNQRTSTVINYACCFSTATFTNLGTNASELIVMSNGIPSQGTFLSQMSNFMAIQTNFATNQSTNIPLLGDIPIPTNGPNRFTSPPVGWVYIKQDVRVKPGSTNTTNVPVARFAFYVQDLSGMIDAERMGGLTNGTPFRQSSNLPTTYIQGTNPAEISLTNLTGTALTSAAKVSNLTSTNNRVKYLSPGMLVLTNGGGLNTNDLRYVTTGLRHWTNAWERVPMGLGYGCSWTNKLMLNSNAINTTPGATLANITNWISTNLPGFTNRAGGMNGTNYLLALAANMIDYTDTDSRATSTNINGVNIVGFDSYPMLTHIYDNIVYTSGPNANVSITTYLQLWNLASKSTATLSNGTFSYSFNQQISYVSTNSGSPTITTNLSATPLANSNFTIPNTNLSANQIIVTSINNTITLANNTRFPGFPSLTNSITISNVTGTHNSFQLVIDGTTIQPAIGFYAAPNSLSNGLPNFTGTILGLEQNSPNLKLWVADPRMLPYRGSGLPASYADIPYTNTIWKSYPARTNPIVSGNPANWPDGTNTSTNPLSVSGTNYTAIIAPSLGISSITDPAPCKISNFGSYTNICELGNIFDPIQWAPAAVTTNYANCDITTGATWTANSMYGGGSTLRIGRPEHSRFAFTNVAGSTVATPNMQMSAAALLDLFCTTNQFDESGQINLNTAPAPVLRALAGGIYLRSDPALSPGSTNFSVPPAMAEAFAQGVMRFRAKYPFYSPSQLAFIGTEPGWPDPSTWPSGAVFGSKDSIFLNSSAPGNSSGASATMGVTNWSDQAAEEWFSKIFKLSTTYSRNYRVYVIAQKATNQGTNFIGVGPVARKYYNILTRINDDADTNTPSASFSTLHTYEAPY